MTKPEPAYQPRFFWTLAMAAVFVGALLTGGGCTKKKNHGALHAESPQENFSPAGCENEALLQKQGRFLVEHIPDSWSATIRPLLKEPHGSTPDEPSLQDLLFARNVFKYCAREKYHPFGAPARFSSTLFDFS